LTPSSAKILTELDEFPRKCVPSIPIKLAIFPDEKVERIEEDA
jgi:hypothetical protein